MNAINNPQGASRIAAPVLDAVQNASARSGIDFDYLFDVARVESGYNPAAQASTSSARGLYQFTKQTWLATLSRPDASRPIASAAQARPWFAPWRSSVASHVCLVN